MSLYSMSILLLVVIDNMHVVNDNMHVARDTNAKMLVDCYVIIQLFHGYAENSQIICHEVVEKIWETVARGRRPRFPDLLHYRGTMV